MNFHDYVHYDSQNGSFTWKVSTGRVSAGSPAGSKRDDGYIVIMINKKKVYAHRLAWFFVHGKWPESLIDHIDGCTSNNKIENLREVDNQTNLQNQRKPQASNKTSGVLGVSWSNHAKRWVACIKHNKKSIRIGAYKDIGEAEQAYIKKKRELHHGCVV